MNGDSAAYFYLACFMMCYLGALGLEALSNGWLIGWEEKRRKCVRKTFFGIICLAFLGATVSLLTNILL